MTHSATVNLRTIPLAQLQPAPYNPRIPLKPGMPGYRRLERSLEEFQLVQPLVWNEQTGHVVGGNQRLEILRNRGVEAVDVVAVSLPLDREKALNVALNNPQIGSEWDTGKLIDLIAELKELDNLDETLTGFDEADLRDLVLQPAGQPTLEDEPPQQDNLVRVAIEIPDDEWESVRPELDELIARWKLTVHVRMPP